MEIPEITKKLQEHEETLKDHERRLHEGDISFALMRQMIERIQSDLTEVKSILKAMQDKPARRWENILNGVINWAVVAFLAYIAFGQGG